MRHLHAFDFFEQLDKHTIAGLYPNAPGLNNILDQILLAVTTSL